MATAVKTKKKSKVDPLLEENETELNDLGPPPSTADLSELFEADSENAGKITFYDLLHSTGTAFLRTIMILLINRH